MTNGMVSHAQCARAVDQLSLLLFAIFILTLTAAESAIGWAILVVLFRNLHTINVDDLDRLKG